MVTYKIIYDITQDANYPEFQAFRDKLREYYSKYHDFDKLMEYVAKEVKNYKMWYNIGVACLFYRKRGKLCILTDVNYKKCPMKSRWRWMKESTEWRL